MSRSTWEQLAPLTGLAFVVIVVVAFVAVGGNTPGIHDPAQKVQSFYADHHSKEMNAGFLVAIGAGFLVFFASTLRNALRAAGGTGRLANAAFGGGLIAAGGLFLAATVHVALADAGANSNTLATAQTLNVLDNDSFIPMVMGLAVLMLAGGWSAIRYGGVPKWLGWIGVILGIAAFTPAGFIAFLGAGLWVAATSIALSLAAGTPAREPAASL